MAAVSKAKIPKRHIKHSMEIDRKLPFERPFLQGIPRTVATGSNL
jgi:hypothetical protein